MMYKKIESLQNPLIKSITLLQDKARNRKQQGLFVIEGVQEIELATKGGYKLQTILFCPDLIQQQAFEPYITSATQLVAITKEIYAKLAYRDTTEGILAVAHSKSLELSEVVLKDNPLILVAEAVEKPGNIGAILRSADAANIDLVIISNPKNDLYNPNVIRSSVGSVFTVPIAIATTQQTIAFLKQKKVNIYCATLQDSTGYHTQDYSQGTAFVVGTESTGITQEFRDNSTKNIIIPMAGIVDSMNVSVAASILLFEAKRQRGFDE